MRRIFSVKMIGTKFESEQCSCKPKQLCEDRFSSENVGNPAKYENGKNKHTEDTIQILTEFHL